jgi:hypothetical protein
MLKAAQRVFGNSKITARRYKSLKIDDHYEETHLINHINRRIHNQLNAKFSNIVTYETDRCIIGHRDCELSTSSGEVKFLEQSDFREIPTSFDLGEYIDSLVESILKACGQYIFLEVINAGNKYIYPCNSYHLDEHNNLVITVPNLKKSITTRFDSFIPKTINDFYKGTQK